MKTHMNEKMRGASEVDPRGGLYLLEQEPKQFNWAGEVWATLTEADGTIQKIYIGKNVITFDASIFIARMCFNNTSVTAGMWGLAVGTGANGWNLQNPPAATSAQRSLFNELARGAFSSVSFTDSLGNPSSIPTNIIDFTTTFSSSQAVGPLVEMGLIAAPINTSPSYIQGPGNPLCFPISNSATTPPFNQATGDVLFNVRNFPVINKGNTATLTLDWRITF